MNYHITISQKEHPTIDFFDKSKDECTEIIRLFLDKVSFGNKFWLQGYTIEPSKVLNIKIYESRDLKDTIIEKINESVTKGNTPALSFYPYIPSTAEVLSSPYATEITNQFIKQLAESSNDKN